MDTVYQLVYQLQTYIFGFKMVNLASVDNLNELLVWNNI